MNAFCSHTVFYFSSPHFPPHSNSLRKAERAGINLTSEMRKLRLRVAKDIIDKSNFGGQKPRASKPMLILYTVPENCNINNRLKQNKTKHLAALGSQRATVSELGSSLSSTTTARSGCLRETMYQLWQFKRSYWGEWLFSQVKVWHSNDLGMNGWRQSSSNQSIELASLH